MIAPLETQERMSGTLMPSRKASTTKSSNSGSSCSSSFEDSSQDDTGFGSGKDKLEGTIDGSGTQGYGVERREHKGAPAIFTARRYGYKGLHYLLETPFETTDSESTNELNYRFRHGQFTGLD